MVAALRKGRGRSPLPIDPFRRCLTVRAPPSQEKIEITSELALQQLIAYRLAEDQPVHGKPSLRCDVLAAEVFALQCAD